MQVEIQNDLCVRVFIINFHRHRSSSCVAVVFNFSQTAAKLAKSISPNLNLFVPIKAIAMPRMSSAWLGVGTQERKKTGEKVKTEGKRLKQTKTHTILGCLRPSFFWWSTRFGCSKQSIDETNPVWQTFHANVFILSFRKRSQIWPLCLFFSLHPLLSSSFRRLQQSSPSQASAGFVFFCFFSKKNIFLP